MKQRDNIPVDIKEELKNIAPRLSELNSTNPFDVPKNYFDSLSDNVLNNVKRQSALVESLRQQENPVATNPFEVPQGYFETLPNVIMQRTSSEPKVIALPSTRWKEWFSMAAAVAAVVMVALPLLK